MKQQLWSLFSKTSVFFLCFTLLSACSALNTTPPDVSLVDLKFGEVAMFETSLFVTTRVRNESSKPLHIDGMVHALSLNGVDLGKAISKQSITLQPLESAQVVSKLEISHLSLAFNLSDLINSPKLDYQLDSEFFLAGFANGSVSTHKSGTLISDTGGLGRPRSANRSLVQ